MKRQVTELEKYFQNTYPTKNWYLEYIMTKKTEQNEKYAIR